MNNSWMLPDGEYISTDSIAVGDTTTILTNYVLPATKGGTGVTSLSNLRTSLGETPTTSISNTVTKIALQSGVATKAYSYGILAKGIWLLQANAEFVKTSTTSYCCADWNITKTNPAPSSFQPSIPYSSAMIKVPTSTTSKTNLSPTRLIIADGTTYCYLVMQCGIAMSAQATINLVKIL